MAPMVGQAPRRPSVPLFARRSVTLHAQVRLRQRQFHRATRRRSYVASLIGERRRLGTASHLTRMDAMKDSGTRKEGGGPGCFGVFSADRKQRTWADLPTPHKGSKSDLHLHSGYRAKEALYREVEACMVQCGAAVGCWTGAARATARDADPCTTPWQSPSSCQASFLPHRAVALGADCPLRRDGQCTAGRQGRHDRAPGAF
jgi:hypothetical protein